MEIIETVKRSCCDSRKDLLEYKGSRVTAFPGNGALKFCKHCGQIWMWGKEPTGPSEIRPVLVKVGQV